MRPLRADVVQNYAGIRFDDNASSITIGLVDSFYLVTDFDLDMPGSISTSDNSNNRIIVGITGVYDVWFNASGESAAANKTFEWYVFELGAAVNITAATDADPVVVTAAGHGFSNGDKCSIKSAGGMVEINDRIFTVQDVSGDTFELTDDGGASPANDIDGGLFTPFTSGGTVQKATQMECHAHRKFSAGGASDVGDFSGGVYVALTKDNTVELYIKGDTDTTSFTNEHMTFGMKRID